MSGVYLWVVFLETYRYVTRWLGSMSHEREPRLWTVSVYTSFPITFFLFFFSWKIRSRFYSTWASHHCASPRRRISSKRRSVEYPTLMCVMRWGALATLMKSCRLKKLLSRGHQKGNRSHNNGRLWWLIFYYTFFSWLFCLRLTKPRIGQALTVGGENPMEN